ncbi:hypothetical protein [Paludisphaera rhizosphaerae]|uniref:hypothetical protein n=1 Tax=Paludisphaera rhizosphaerae TaxID=2711216 RepID=UPI0013EC085E|nr:hypothetical protein [Paludisphaera rhizosphaerae]
MDEFFYVYATAGLMAAYFVWQVATKRFDPFAPVWMFFVGYIQVYVIQPISFHDWAVNVRGVELVTLANYRAFLALAWFLLVYHSGIGGLIARRLPESPRGWSTETVALISPVLIVWGMFCAGVFGGGVPAEERSAEEALLRSFPFVMMTAAVLLMATGRRADSPRPAYFYVGLMTAAAYVVIWMFNGKRSHSLMGVLATVAVIYTTKGKRPSWSVLGGTAFAGALVVTLAIGWRNNPDYERSFSGFVEYVGDFDPAKMLVSMDVVGEYDDPDASYETKEYGGYLLMLATVPEKAGYDYGQSYFRVVSTFIPRIVWPTKPLFGRDQWRAAWVAGSEYDREEDFAGPAIGILGAAQLNGGDLGTILVMAGVAIFLRLLYDYFLLYAHTTWAQFFWSIFFFNAWFMVVTDDPMVWFYYNWAFSAFPVVVFTWIVARWCRAPQVQPQPQAAAPQGFGWAGAPAAGFPAHSMKASHAPTGVSL